MIHEHKYFDFPDEPTQVVWRYFDLAKFAYLIEAGGLWFSRLATLTDKFEGSWPPEPDPDDLLPETVERRRLSTEQWYLLRRQQYCVNCWNMNADECPRMWIEYVKGSDGVAVKTTIGNLFASLKKLEIGLYAAKVKYIDFGPNAETDRSNDFAPVGFKLTNFEHEKEMRLVYCTYAVFGDDLIAPPNFNQYSAGFTAPTDLDGLIGELVISPNAQGFVQDLIAKLLVTHGLGSKPVRPSKFTMPTLSFLANG